MIEAYRNDCSAQARMLFIREQSECGALALSPNQAKDECITSFIMGTIKTTVGRVRIVGIIEGISYLLLLGIAMPLKYLVGIPQAVQVIGMAHGVLFIAFCLVLLQAWIGGQLSLRWSAIAFIATLIPFGPFLIDKKLATFDTSPSDPA
jgi:integral membrane protein